MAYEALKAKFPAEGSRCLKSCGKCCSATAPFQEKEGEAIAQWIVDNKSVEELTAQFQHFDDQPAKCPFLQPDKGCFIYPVRPVVCVMFGHLPDAPGTPKHWSQQCTEGVVFTQVSFDEISEEAMEWFIDTTKAEAGRMIGFRMLEMVGEDGTEGIVPVKPGSAFERMRKAKNCYRCNVEIPEGGKMYLESGELLCQKCEDAMAPGSR